MPWNASKTLRNYVTNMQIFGFFQPNSCKDNERQQIREESSTLAYELVSSLRPPFSRKSFARTTLRCSKWTEKKRQQFNAARNDAANVGCFCSDHLLFRPYVIVFVEKIDSAKKLKRKHKLNRKAAERMYSFFCSSWRWYHERLLTAFTPQAPQHSTNNKAKQNKMNWPIN